MGACGDMCEWKVWAQGVVKRQGGGNMSVAPGCCAYDMIWHLTPPPLHMSALFVPLHAASP